MTDLLFHTLIGQTIIGYFLMFTIPALIPISFYKLVGLKGLRNALTFEPKDTIIHRLDPRLKVVYPAIMGTLSVFLSWNWVYALLLFCIVPWIMLKPSRTRLRFLLVMTVVPALGEVWSQGIVYNFDNQYLFRFPWTLSWTGVNGLSVQGLEYGLQQAGRFLITVLSSLLLVFTTEPSDIIWACMKLKLPVKLGFALSAGLRFMPLMFERLSILLQAMEVRGYDFSRPDRWWNFREWADYFKRVIVALPLITVPLLINSLRGTHIMAMVADARAFGAHPYRGSFKNHEHTWEDRAALGYYAFLIAGVCLLLSLGIGLRSNYG
ncbi:energy-coupling factor transporter transmembrane component T [Paenibacillus filicis]|uniref:Energy-coupling factor transporter transmembrane component T n=1 Tax=Paenibacillus gyeongsangnamensis TaxID=3388067 RepID=A0ABT4QBY2_9BACL|nr:energy-coupling factor transporter transmembrane component T [Paenibacillus filicis]MCZ8514398.1 energy-coupling factor transporter transmembrane component T [Paenibacillus filicis]